MKKIMNLFILAELILCCLLMSCDEDDFLMNKSEYEGDDLTLNGYYYILTDYGSVSGIHFFYRNGITRTLGSVKNSFEEMDDYIREMYLPGKNPPESRLQWGLYKIKDKRITIEMVYDYGRITVMEGDILNDTTFHLTSSYRQREPDNEEKMDRYYYFREFSPKPDSINKYIK